MLKVFFILTCFLAYSGVMMCQQSDTIFLDDCWKPCNKKESNYYRITQKLDSVYKITDYYSTGVLQMDGIVTNLNPEIYDGLFTYYHANGSIESQGSYNDNKKIGIWNYYYNNGHLKSKGRYVDDKQVGNWKYYNLNGNFYDSYDFDKDIQNRSSDSLPKLLSDIPISSTDKNFSIALRGKLFGFFIIEDVYFSTATIGTEFLIKGKHSQGNCIINFEVKFLNI